MLNNLQKMNFLINDDFLLFIYDIKKLSIVSDILISGNAKNSSQKLYIIKLLLF